MLTGFLQGLYSRFAKVYSNTCSNLCVTIVALFIVKIIQSLEGARSGDTLPAGLWGKLAKHFNLPADALPTYSGLLHTCIPASAEIYPLLDSLDTHKFNLLPMCLNGTDIVLRSALHLNRAGWRIWAFWISFVRRFANNAMFLIGILHFYYLVGGLKIKAEDVTLETMLSFELLDNYTAQIKFIFFNYDAEVMHTAMRLACLCSNSGKEPPFGYLLPPYTLPKISGERRFIGYARGAGKLIDALQPGTAGNKPRIKSLTEFHSQMHQFITKTEGFILYQIDIGISDYSRQSNEKYVAISEREPIAGPGMVGMCLKLVEIHGIDDSHLCGVRDLGEKSTEDTETGYKRQSDSDAQQLGTATKKAKTVITKATDDQLRQAISLCMTLSVFLVDHELWRIICHHYGLSHLCVEPNDHAAIKQQVAQRLYHEIEYLICETRRLILAPLQRQPVTQGNKTWISRCRQLIVAWRHKMITTRRF